MDNLTITGQIWNNPDQKELVENCHYDNSDRLVPGQVAMPDLKALHSTGTATSGINNSNLQPWRTPSAMNGRQPDLNPPIPHTVLPHVVYQRTTSPQSLFRPYQSSAALPLPSMDAPILTQGINAVHHPDMLPAIEEKPIGQRRMIHSHPTNYHTLDTLHPPILLTIARGKIVSHARYFHSVPCLLAGNHRRLCPLGPSQILLRRRRTHPA